MSKTFQIIRANNGNKAIKCLICNMTSYSQGDVDFEFCAKCGKFHSEMQNNIRMEHPNLTSLSKRLADEINMATADGLNTLGTTILIEDYIKKHSDLLKNIIDEEVKPYKTLPKILAKRFMEFIS